jgi:phosphoribosylanthranilate isomerase
MTRVKICGVRELADALVAAEAGADFVGLVFVPGRRRCLEPGTAKDIVTGLRAPGGPVPRVVGLFAGQPLGEVNRIIRTCGLDLAQLCGGETLEYCQKVRCQVIKVVHVDAPASRPVHPEPVEGQLEQLRGSTSSPRAVESREDMIAALGDSVRSYRDAGHLVTLDRLVEGFEGGTGASFDWEVAASLSRRGLSFLLAGGLSPSNVAQAVASARPWGVDVSSGVETDGAKDQGKIRAFIERARQQSAINRQLPAQG